MEDILDLYQRAYHENAPIICFDEKPVQLVSEKRTPLPVKPGHPALYDYEYVRQGTRNLFGFFEPKAGWRHIAVTDRRTKDDFCEQMRYLVEDRYPHARTIHVVLDNLNTHRLHHLYEVFEAPHARAIAKKLQFHFTPVHASWLNMIEIEFSVLQRQCLNRRIGTEKELEERIEAWQEKRNEEKASVSWQFTTTKARKKMAKHYPSTPR